uniref:BBS1 domain-containing protein n=1 Tax=Panagrellus redivivus TaxID=6233 RepID=A0A7E4WAL7_PANRE
MGLDDEGPKRWIRLIFEANTNLHTSKANVTTANITGDGEFKLIVADQSPAGCRIKLFKGLTLVGDTFLSDPPVGIVTFRSEDAMVPCVAVAVGGSLLIYRNMRPYYRCNLEPMDQLNEEVELWKGIQEKQIDAEQLFTGLNHLRLRHGLQRLSFITQKYLTLTPKERPNAITTLLSDKAKIILTNVTVTYVTTMTRRVGTGETSDIIVISTEQGIYWVDSAAFTIMAQHKVTEGTPMKIMASGYFEEEHRLLIALREGDICLLKRVGDGRISTNVMGLRTHVVAFCRTNTMLVIACRNHSLIFCNHKGKKLTEKNVGETIVDVDNFEYEPRVYKGALVALKNRIDLYFDTLVVDSLKFDLSISWIRYGPCGREMNSLIIGHDDTSIGIYAFRRAGIIDEAAASKPAKPSLAKLNIPKKTKTFVDQCYYERENLGRMFSSYQRDMYMLRFHVTRAFAELTTTQSGVLPTKEADKMDISLDLHGFGPFFRISLKINCADTMPDVSRWFAFAYDKSEYKCEKELIPVTKLVSRTTSTYSNGIQCLHPEKGLQSDVKVYLLASDRRSPFWTTTFEMPVSEAGSD